MASYKLSEDFIKTSMESSLKEIFKRDMKKKIMDDVSKDIDSILDQALTDFIGRIDSYEDFGRQEKVFIIRIDGIEKIKDSLNK